MTQTPNSDLRAEMMAFTALVLERAQADPDRAPGTYLVEWHRRVARRLETLPRHPSTNRDLLDGALRLHRIYRGLPDPLHRGPSTVTMSEDVGAEGTPGEAVLPSEAG